MDTLLNDDMNIDLGLADKVVEFSQKCPELFD
jgi:hypothetical protein